MGEWSDRDGATAVAELVYLLDEAFAGSGIEESNEAQSLLANLATVGEEQWRTVPNGGVRTVESIALHVGACQVMYDAYAFGSGGAPLGGPRPDAVARRPPPRCRRPSIG